MKTVKDVFYDAIKHGNWDNVCRVYEKITGEEAPPFPAQNNILDTAMVESQPTNIMDESMVEDEHDIVTSTTEDPQQNGDVDFTMPQKPRTHTDGQTRQCRREPIGKPKNTWVDDGTEHADESVKIRPELGVPHVRKRDDSRDPNIGIDTGKKTLVMCALCGREEVVSSRLAIGYNPDPEENTYRCNNCLSPTSRTMRNR
jgi:hypothetical protein